MKTVIYLISVIALLSLISCSGVNVKPVQPCIVDTPDGTIEFNSLCEKLKLEGEKSYICDLSEKHVDACYLHRSMEIISKEGLVMEGYTSEEFEQWGNYLKTRIEAGMTYGILRDVILAQFTKMNRMLGAQVLILGDMFLQLPQDAVIPEADTIIVSSSIDDLINEVKALGIWL